VHVQQGRYGGALHAVIREHGKDKGRDQRVTSMLLLAGADVDASAEEAPAHCKWSSNI
jgi:hypothetical protein